ncbi:MBOAT family protein [Trichuris trichiura]|uniref:MBOAT family protein n=1 Tax=Trichuris trichiura TaxID=36087 RepID=A0A077Z3J3_TRITR|nr:MBOAT family protein [Trichuris trichiura]
MDFEVLVCFVVWASHAAYAWYSVWKASYAYLPRLLDYGATPGWSILSERPKDSTNFEWFIWKEHVTHYLFALILHAGTLPAVMLCLPGRLAKPVLISLWLCLNCLAYGSYPVIVAIGYACILYTTVLLFKTAKSLWVVAVLLFLALNTRLFTPMAHVQYYLFCVFVTYKLLQFVSYLLFTLSKTEKGSVLDDVTHLLFYCLYLPYSTVLFVTYEQFRSQWLARRPLGQRNLPKVLWLATRILFWTFFCDFVLHFCFMNAMVQDYEFLRYVSVDVLCSVVYTAGQFFHSKYVCIFGLFKVFAHVDGMEPPDLPVCISRVALYSRIWRHFDRGLYTFLNTHIFHPLSEAIKYPDLRRVCAGAACFLFVWLFHGQSYSFAVWSFLNFVETMFEYVGCRIDRRLSVVCRLRKLFGIACSRRILAVLQLPCIVVSVFSIAFFLGGADTGFVLIRRILIDEHFQLRPVFFYLISLGYCFVQSTMEVERLRPFAC